ncbi:TldD/PmbA family protein [Candidatus Bathyarchaeota archaeon]|nr:MAG: TldD/PmbA family protein [Candidatus Bathyarchaeota archaeon]
MMRYSDIPSRLVKFALTEGATDAAISLVELDRSMIRFSNNEVTIFKNYRERMLKFYVMIKERRAESDVAVAPIRKLEADLRRLIEKAKKSPPSDIYAPLPQGPFKYDSSLLKPKGEYPSPERLIGFVTEAIDGAVKSGAKRAAGSLIASKVRKTLCTSGDVNVTSEKYGLEISVRAFTSNVSSGHFVSVAENAENFNPEIAGVIAGEIAKNAENPQPGKAGRYQALLGPMVFADFVNQVGILSSAFLVDAGQSFLADKLEEEVASKIFSLIDDPTLKGTYGSKPFDDEGVPTRRNVIVDNGVLRTYLHNSVTARKFRTETTGNAGLVVPRPWNLIVNSGQKNFDELLSEVDEGVLVTNDWYLRYQNYRTGDFSAIPRDGLFYIKDGGIEKSIRELRISDNMLRIFRNLEGLSRERYWIKWWEVDVPTLTPCALVSELNFTKSTM